MSVTAAREAPVSVEVKVTGALGTTASVGSTTVPSNALETVCPNRQAVKKCHGKDHLRKFPILIGIRTPLQLVLQLRSYLNPKRLPEPR